MADFRIWERDTLNRFAQDATDKLREKTRQILHLERLLKQSAEREAALRLQLDARQWTEVAAGLPDDDELVVVELADGEVWPAYLDAGRWFYVTSDRIESSRVLRWQAMPEGKEPIGSFNHDEAWRTAVTA